MNIGLNISIATEAILHNKLRTLLTSLGIIFGVGSVIAMLSVGKGAEQEIMEQMKALGANNVIVKPIIEQQESKVEKDPDKKKKKKWSPGLRVSDIDAIRAELPGVEYVSPEIVVEC